MSAWRSACDQNVSFAASCMKRSPALASGRPKLVVRVSVVSPSIGSTPRLDQAR
jgi:hypothetical protein